MSKHFMRSKGTQAVGNASQKCVVLDSSAVTCTQICPSCS